MILVNVFRRNLDQIVSVVLLRDRLASLKRPLHDRGMEQYVNRGCVPPLPVLHAPHRTYEHRHPHVPKAPKIEVFL